MEHALIAFLQLGLVNFASGGFGAVVAKTILRIRVTELVWSDGACIGGVCDRRPRCAIATLFRRDRRGGDFSSQKGSADVPILLFGRGGKSVPQGSVDVIVSLFG